MAGGGPAGLVPQVAAKIKSHSGYLILKFPQKRKRIKILLDKSKL
uniref:Uncharacterized protein n=1 Tax=Siphoviridae sp. ct3pR10 TaxID=2826284 RepID=A0A8S5LWG9_9CAUD|nr:MAG TPA: hypothetical protein [Siphoviridae sp. ct3pR10]